MYRMHDFECPSCHFVKEELCDVPPSMVGVQCHKCGSLMEHVVMGGKAHVFRAFWHPHLDHTPVHISSWRQYKEEMQKRNLANPLGS